MKSSKITTKYQATIPKDIRKQLKLQAGDSVTFEVLDDGLVVLRKTKPLDKEYLKALNTLLTEWKTAYDEEDFEHLQDL